MQIKVSAPGMCAHNKYAFKLIDTRNNAVKAEATAYNVINSDKYIAYLIGCNTSYRKGPFAYLQLGNGLGKPSLDDTMLFSYSTSVPVNTEWTCVSSKTAIDKTFSTEVVFPATTAYVGKYTEVGLGRLTNGELCSHAMLQDAEGHTIEIEKTSYDMLVITVTMYFHIKLPTSHPYNIAYLHPLLMFESANGITTHHQALARNDKSYLYATKLPSPSGTQCNTPGTANDTLAQLSSGLCCIYACQDILETDSNGYAIGLPLALAGYSRNVSSSTADSTVLITDNTAASSTTYPYTLYAFVAHHTAAVSESLPMTGQLINARCDQAFNNMGFIHSLYIAGIGVIALPNENLIPAYKYNNISIGTGDNKKTNFFTPVNEIVSSTVYIDGVVTAATFVNFDIKKSPLWGKAYKVQWFDSDDKNVIHEEFPEDSLYVHEYQVGNYMVLPMSGKIVNSDWYAIQAKNAIGCAPTVRSAVVYYDPKGISLDHFRVGAGIESTGTASQATCKLEYSHDGNNWIETVYTADVQPFTTQYFEKVTAPWWRIHTVSKLATDSISCPQITVSAPDDALSWVLKTDLPNGYNYWVASGKITTACGYDPKWMVAGDSSQLDFGKVGVNFATPPSAGAKVTMNATLNLPYKNTDSILTISYQVERPSTLE